MNSKFYLKKESIHLRKKGYTYPEIEEKLGVPRGTLNTWFKGLVLPKQAQERILERKRVHIKNAQRKASEWHINTNLHEREVITNQIELGMKEIVWGKDIQEFLLGVLYLGEGFKSESMIGLGNSNPLIVKFFIDLLKSIYKTDISKFRCFLHLRSDQDEIIEKKFWSKVLDIPIQQFGKSQFDRRTLGKKTWIGYHGVCAVKYYDAQIEKRLTAIQSLLLEKFFQKNYEDS